MRGRPLTKREILLRARKLIENGDERYICLAIDAVLHRYRRSDALEVNKKIASAKVTDLKGFIMSLLFHGHERGQRPGTLEGWLFRRGKRSAYRYSRRSTCQQIRLRWIDWMLTQPEVTDD